MKITRIETLHSGMVAVVKVVTDDGAEGIGQTAPFRSDITADVLHKMVAPVFLGANPWDINALEEECLRRNYKFTGTFLYRALCGVDTALWDLLGKITGQPVYRLMGGKVRDSFPVYASSMVRDTTPEEETQRVVDAAARSGFRCAKVKVGGRMGWGGDDDPMPGRTERLIRTLRETLGAEFDLIADANSSFSVIRAIEVGRMLEEHGFYFYEEPCNFMDLDSTAQVTAALEIPVAGGEQDNSLHQFDRMIREGVVDIVQPDIGYLGGMIRARRVAEMAAQAEIPCTPHCSNHSMLQLFSAHLIAAMPACYQYQEYNIESFTPWADGIYEPALQVVNGEISVPDAPGWGVSLLPEFVKESEQRVSSV